MTDNSANFGAWLNEPTVQDAVVATLLIADQPLLLREVALECRLQISYRFWRDSGYVLGGLVAGGAADALGYGSAIGIVAGLTAASGLWVLHDMPAHKAG